MTTEDDLRKEIADLKARLEATNRPTEFSAKESKYKEHPVLVFEGPKLIKPMTLGLNKLRAIIACLPQVEAFLGKHSANEKTSAKPRLNLERP